MIPKSGSRFSESIMLKQMLERADVRRKAIPLEALLICRLSSAINTLAVRRDAAHCKDGAVTIGLQIAAKPAW